MYSSWQLAKKYLNYTLTASNGKGHGIHSPFVFDFVRNVLNDKRYFYAYEAVERMREKLLINKTPLTVEDFGAGSSINKRKQKTIASIAKNTSKSKKLGQLLYRIAAYYQPSLILELGTSLGVSTSYLASGNLNSTVISCEGSPAVADAAMRNLSSLGLHNVHLRIGNFDDTLEAILSSLEKLDLVFIDGNHRMEPTMRYFHQILPKMHEQSIVVFDDIHWSEEMENAWEHIKEHPAVTCSIDLFFLGFVFFRTEFKVKQHFIIRF